MFGALFLSMAWPIPSANPGQVHSDPLAAQNLANSTEHGGVEEWASRIVSTQQSTVPAGLCRHYHPGAGTFGNLGSEQFGY